MPSMMHGARWNSILPPPSRTRTTNNRYFQAHPILYGIPGSPEFIPWARVI